MNLTEYNKYLEHFCKVNDATSTWRTGNVAFSLAYSYYEEDWVATLKLAQDFLHCMRRGVL